MRFASWSDRLPAGLFFRRRNSRFYATPKYLVVIRARARAAWRFEGRGSEGAERRSISREIADGDLVVHLEHGIGKYRGIQKLQQNGSEQEVVVLEFANDARLYVPFEQAFLVSRYVGIGKRVPDA